MTTRKLAMAGALGLASLGLIGAGAGATFTDAVNVQQKITAGTIDMQLTSPNSTVSFSSDGKTATFANLGPTASTFTSGAVATTITNHGNITANAIQLSASHVLGTDAHSAALASELCVKIVSSNQVAYDGKLSGLESQPLQLQGPVPPGGTDSFTTEFYAGKGACASLDNAAEGGVVTPTVTVSYQG